MSFRHYRQASGYSESSIKVQDSHVNRFLSWSVSEGIDPEGITYNHVLRFIDHDFTNLPKWHYQSDRAELIHQRNMVVLGLMIYQGLDSGQIARLELRHLNLEEGEIYIPSGRKSNARLLQLDPVQILLMKTYMRD